MKKVLVIMLATLLLFSFTSCSNDNSSKVEEQKKEYEEKLQTEKDKQEAMIKAFEDFMAAYKTDYENFKGLWDCYDHYDGCRFDGSAINLTLSDSKYPQITAGILEKYGFINLLEEGQQYTGGSNYPKADPAPSGTVTGTVQKSTNNYDLTFTENKFTLSYSIYSSEDTTQTPVKSGDLEVTISGTYKEETTDEKHSVDYDITINGTRYQLAYTYDKTTKKVTSASVNGTAVEVRLFNADGLSLVK
jgi:hypothetical protein